MITELHKVNFKKHIMSTHVDDVRCIAAPLKRLAKITHFSYTQLSMIHNRKAEIILTTHPGFAIDIFYPEKFYEVAFFGDIEEYRDGYYLWVFFKDNVVYNAAAQNIGMMNGINIVKKHADHCEFYFFATKETCPSINQFFVNHLDLFEAFILYFKEKAEKLLRLAKNNRIIMPSSSGDQTVIPVQNYNSISCNKAGLTSTDKTDDRSLKTHKLTDFDCFYEQYNNDNKNILNQMLLSKRERQCAQLVLEGMTAKETAGILGISNRTVEVYFNRLKKRLDCKNKLLLVKKLSESHYNFTNRNTDCEQF